MRFHIFRVEVLDPAPGQDALNAFCAQHRVCDVEKRFVDLGAHAYWTFCVATLDGEESPSRRVDKRSASTTLSLMPPVLDYQEKQLPQRWGGRLDFLVDALRLSTLRLDPADARNAFCAPQRVCDVEERFVDLGAHADRTFCVATLDGEESPSRRVDKRSASTTPSLTPPVLHCQEKQVSQRREGRLVFSVDALRLSTLRLDPADARNAFCAPHRVCDVEERFVDLGAHADRTFCVATLDGEESPSRRVDKRSASTTLSLTPPVPHCQGKQVPQRRGGRLDFLVDALRLSTLRLDPADARNAVCAQQRVCNVDKRFVDLGAHADRTFCVATLDGEESPSRRVDKRSASTTLSLTPPVLDCQEIQVPQQRGGRLDFLVDALRLSTLRLDPADARNALCAQQRVCDVEERFVDLGAHADRTFCVATLDGEDSPSRRVDKRSASTTLSLTPPVLHCQGKQVSQRRVGRLVFLVDALRLSTLRRQFAEWRNWKALHDSQREMRRPAHGALRTRHGQGTGKVTQPATCRAEPVPPWLLCCPQPRAERLPPRRLA